jgi:hypothetical protein
MTDVVRRDSLRETAKNPLMIMHSRCHCLHWRQINALHRLCVAEWGKIGS